jgi:hypothetical protein
MPQRGAGSAFGGAIFFLVVGVAMLMLFGYQRARLVPAFVPPPAPQSMPLFSPHSVDAPAPTFQVGDGPPMRMPRDASEEEMMRRYLRQHPNAIR